MPGGHGEWAGSPTGMIFITTGMIFIDFGLGRDGPGAGKSPGTFRNRVVFRFSLSRALSCGRVAAYTPMDRGEKISMKSYTYVLKRL